MRSYAVLFIVFMTSIAAVCGERLSRDYLNPNRSGNHPPETGRDSAG